MLQRLRLCRASDTVFRREIDSRRQWGYGTCYGDSFPTAKECRGRATKVKCACGLINVWNYFKHSIGIWCTVNKKYVNDYIISICDIHTAITHCFCLSFPKSIGTSNTLNYHTHNTRMSSSHYCMSIFSTLPCPHTQLWNVIVSLLYVHI